MKNLVKQPFFHIILLVLVAGILGLLFKKYVANRENFNSLSNTVSVAGLKSTNSNFIEKLLLLRKTGVITRSQQEEICKGCKVIKNDEDEITGCKKTVDFIGNNGKVMKQQMPCTGLNGFRCSPCDEYYDSLTDSDEKTAEIKKDRIEVSSNDTPTVPPQQPVNQNNIIPNLKGIPINPSKVKHISNY